MEKRVRDFIAENSLFCPGQTVGAAVSGGPDSMALLNCLHALAPFFSYSVACVHFEHGIRGQESLDDADFVEGFCEKHGIPFYMSAADVPALAREWKVSLETAAKRAREAYFDTLVKNGDVDVIATGHQSDDYAESVLMHILRGCGTDGLRGIAVRKGDMIRPLLCVSRADVMSYIRENGIRYVEDKTNCDDAYTRNFVRNILLPQIRERVNPDISGALIRLGAAAREDSAFILEEAERIFPECAVKRDDRVDIDLESFLRLSPAVAYRVIKLACAELFVTQDIEKAHVGAVVRLARSRRTGARASLMGGLCAEVEYGTLVIRFSARRADHSFCQWFDAAAKNETPGGDYIVCTETDACDFANQEPDTAYVDRDKLPARIAFRTRYAGDRITPLGSGGSKKLKDYFIDKKLTREQREKTPLLADGSRIIWVVGHTIGDDYKVDGTTRHILRMDYIRRDRNKEADGGNS